MLRLQQPVFSRKPIGTITCSDYTLNIHNTAGILTRDTELPNTAGESNLTVFVPITGKSFNIISSQLEIFENE
jgi:hypothetical protein